MKKSDSGRSSALRWFVALVLGAVGLSSGARAWAQTTPIVIPAGTVVHFHLIAPVSSDKSKTGGSFGFALLAPIVVPGVTIPVAGTAGVGTIILAGHAGNAGHEGDLTLRIDSLETVDGHYVQFDNQRFEMNGHNRKIASAGLGFVPMVGYASILIRGSEVHVDPTQAIDTVLARRATVGVGSPPPAPSPTPSGGSRPAAAPAAPLPSETPTVVPTFVPPASPTAAATALATAAPAPLPVHTLSPPPPP